MKRLIFQKICIPIEDKPQGGMYTFLRYFRQYLCAQQIDLTDDLEDDYDVLFVNSFVVSAADILKAKRSHPGLRVIQRVDGSTRAYGRQDASDSEQTRVNLLADLTIFQSQYSKFSTRRKYKVIPGNGPVIFNPVDCELFHPGTDMLPPGQNTRVCSISFSTNPKKGTWHIGALAEANSDVEFVLCGHFPKLPDLSNIVLMGHLSPVDLAEVLRSCHIFLHLAENDPCPNVVIEALASGLPVLFKPSGGTPELVGPCGYPVTEKSFRYGLEYVLAHWRHLAITARQRACNLFGLNKVLSEYVHAITYTHPRRTPVLLRRLWAKAIGYRIKCND